MSKNEFPIIVLIDTNALHEATELFNHPDFRKLLEYAKEGVVKIYISKISWEERRTQILASVIDNTNNIKKTVKKLKDQQTNKMVLNGLPEPLVAIWSDKELEENSIQAMESFAEENKITILPYTKQHNDNVWERYFNIKPPFNSQEPDRNKRRKDLPDAFILEAAIELIKKEKKGIAIGKDGALNNALKEEGYEILEKFSDVINLVENIKEEKDSANEEASDEIEVHIEPEKNEIFKLFFGAKERLIKQEINALGVITFFDEISTSDFQDILEKMGVDRNESLLLGQNLVSTKLVSKVGNNYLSKPSKLAKLAEESIAPKIPELIEDE